MSIRTALLALCLAVAGLSAPAQEDIAAQAERAAARLTAARALIDGAGGASDRIAALTEAVQAYEDGLGALREGLRRVAVRRRMIETELNAREEEVAALLGTLLTMGRAPAPLLLLHPSGPIGTARSGLILSDVTPALQARADELTAQLAELRELAALQDRAAAGLRSGLDGVQEARAALAEAVSDRTDLPRRFTQDPDATAQLLASTETLDAFAGGLAQIVGGDLGVAAPDAGDRIGSLPLPVQGRILRRFGDAVAAGIVRPGLVIATRPRALVTAPAAATLRFRGPLLDYGNVAILEPSSGVLIVLAGLADVFGEVGQVLPEGAPVGLMGGDTPPAHAILTESALGTGGTRSETLYLEVRDGQSPIDPATWFVTGD